MTYRIQYVNTFTDENTQVRIAEPIELAIVSPVPYRRCGECGVEEGMPHLKGCRYAMKLQIDSEPEWESVKWCPGCFSTNDNHAYACPHFGICETCGRRKNSPPGMQIIISKAMEEDVCPECKMLKPEPEIEEPETIRKPERWFFCEQCEAAWEESSRRGCPCCGNAGRFWKVLPTP